MSGSRSQPRLDESIEEDLQDGLFVQHLQRYHFAMSWAVGRRCLDVGCGRGYGSQMLATVAAQVLATDMCPEVLDLARTRHQHPRLSFGLMDARELALGSGAFDFVVSFEVIEHFEQQATFLRELNRVLAPGGHALLSTPNAEIERLHLHRSGRPNPHHVASLHPAEFGDLLEAHFPRVQLFGQRGTGGRLYSLLKALDFWNLRHRLIPPTQQDRVRDVLGPQSSGPSFDDFDVAPGLIRQSSTILGLCGK